MSDQNRGLQSFEQGKFSENIEAPDSEPQEKKENVEHAPRDEQLTAGKGTPEITTNDGSVVETLDTAFHGTPGWSGGEGISGSNRADYYEERSYGKSDAEEELDDLRERNKSTGSDGNNQAG
jgi:hypothetical protein